MLPSLWPPAGYLYSHCEKCGTVSSGGGGEGCEGINGGRVAQQPRDVIRDEKEMYMTGMKSTSHMDCQTCFAN